VIVTLREESVCGRKFRGSATILWKKLLRFVILKQFCGW